MHAVFFLPNSSGYKDRIALLQEVSRLIGAVTLLVGKNDLSEDVVESDTFKVKEVGFVSGARLWNLWKASRRLSTIRNVDVIHDTSGNLILTFFALKLRRDRPVLVTSFFALEKWRIKNVWEKSGYSTLKLLINQTTRKMYLGAFVQRVMSMLSDYVILQAPGLINRLTDYAGVDKDKVNVLANNVDTDFWKVDPNSVKISAKFQILYVGGLDHSRGIFSLIEALKMIREMGLNVSLRLVVKEGMLGKQLIEEYLQKKGVVDHVIFSNRLTREQMRAAYNESDLLVYQTINDGSPRVVLEALSCGLPVVASHHPGINILDPVGEFIQFTKYADIDSMVKAIIEIITDGTFREKISKMGIQTMTRNFRSEVIALQYASFYESVLPTHKNVVMN